MKVAPPQSILHFLVKLIPCPTVTLDFSFKKYLNNFKTEAVL